MINTITVFRVQTPIKSEILAFGWLSKLDYSIYMIQRVPMPCLNEISWYYRNFSRNSMASLNKIEYLQFIFKIFIIKRSWILKVFSMTFFESHGFPCHLRVIFKYILLFSVYMTLSGLIHFLYFKIPWLCRM